MIGRGEFLEWASVYGYLYGTTSSAGAYAGGTVYKVALNGAGFTVIHNFQANDGITPTGGLVQGSDGALYGMTSEGGNYGAGTLFRITTNGAFTVLRHFNYDTDGGSPAR